MDFDSCRRSHGSIDLIKLYEKEFGFPPKETGKSFLADIMERFDIVSRQSATIAVICARYQDLLDIKMERQEDERRERDGDWRKF